MAQSTFDPGKGLVGSSIEGEKPLGKEPGGGFGKGHIEVVSRAAKEAGIPFWVLWGVFGAESSWGKGGNNWFGLVAVPRTGSFEGDAKVSAHLLANLYYHLYGRNWDKALRAYSGGSYGEAHIRNLVKQSEPTQSEKEQAASETPSGNESTKGKCASITIPVAGSVNLLPIQACESFEAIGSVFKFISHAAGWARIGKVLLGFILLILAIDQLAKVGTGSNNPSIIRKVSPI